MSLLSLPNELFDLIVSEIVKDRCPGDRYHDGQFYILRDGDAILTLKALRQVCKQASRMTSVNAALFRDVKLIADSKHVIGEGEMEASGIAPYVKHISFCQPLYGSMSLDDFIWVYSFSARSIKRYNGKPRAERQKEEQSTIRSVAKNMIGGRPVTEIAKGYQQYNSIAVESWLQLHDRQALVDAWVAILRLCSKCTSFSIPRVEYMDMSLDFRPSGTGPRRLDCERSDIQDRLDMVSCDLAVLFVPAVFACLAAASSRVQRLSLSHIYKSETWTHGDHLENVDLSGLSSLTVAPVVFSRVYSDPALRDRMLEKRCILLQKDTNHLLSICSSSLEYFKHEPQLKAWGDVGIPTTMQKLTTVELGGCEVDANWFSRWLLALPQLLSLTIGSCSVEYMSLHEEEPERCKVILDALRNHPTLLTGIIWLDLDGRWRFKFDKNKILSDWDNHHNQKLYEEALGRPDEFRELLDEDHRTYLHLTRERLAKFYVCGAINWPGIESFFADTLSDEDEDDDDDGVEEEDDNGNDGIQDS